MDDVALRNMTYVCICEAWKELFRGYFDISWFGPSVSRRPLCSRFFLFTRAQLSVATDWNHQQNFVKPWGKTLWNDVYDRITWVKEFVRTPERKTSPIGHRLDYPNQLPCAKRWNRWFTDRPTRNVLENIPSYLKMSFVSNRKYVYTGWMYHPSDMFNWNARRHMQRIRWILSSGVPQVLCGWRRDRSFRDIKSQLMTFCKDFLWLKVFIFWSDVMFLFPSPPWHIWWLTSSVHVWHERTSSYKSFCEEWWEHRPLLL